MALNKRIEVRFEEHEYELIRREASRREILVGKLIRDVVREHFVEPGEKRRAEALTQLTSGRAVDVGDWDEAKKLIGRWVDKELYP